MKYLKLEFQNQFAVIKINKPETLNALTISLLREMDDGINIIEEKIKDLRCVVITGEGEKSFVAGADVAEMNSMDPNTAEQFSFFGNSIFERIFNLEIPTIAAVNGYALGGGFELALACDLIIASENAIFGLPETGLGLIPGYGGTFRVSKQVGMRIAKWLMFTGSKISAQRAYEIGIVSLVCPKEVFWEKVLETVEKIKRCAPLSVIECKKLIHKANLINNDQCIKAETESFGFVFQTEDRKEGTQAFVDKCKVESFKRK